LRMGNLHSFEPVQTKRMARVHEYDSDNSLDRSGVRNTLAR